MSRMIVGLGLLGTSLVLVAAPVPKDRPPLAVYHATKVGDRLTYVMDTGAATTEMVEEVTEVERKGDEVIVTVSRELKGKGVTSKLSVSARGLFRVSSGPTTYDPPVCLLKLSAKPGDTWESDLPTAKATGRKMTYTFRGEEEVEVPAGKFKALKVEAEQEFGKSVRMTYWYVPGLGMVKSAIKFNDTERGYVLKSFTPGK